MSVAIYIFMTLFMHICSPLLCILFPTWVAGLICCMGGVITPNVMHQISIRLSVNGDVSLVLLLLELPSLFNPAASICAKSKIITVGLGLGGSNDATANSNSGLFGNGIMQRHLLKGWFG